MIYIYTLIQTASIANIDTMIATAAEKRLKLQAISDLISLQPSHDTGEIVTLDTEPEQATILHTTSTGEDVMS